MQKKSIKINNNKKYVIVLYLQLKKKEIIHDLNKKYYKMLIDLSYWA